MPRLIYGLPGKNGDMTLGLLPRPQPSVMESPMKTTRSSPAAGALDLLVVGGIAVQVAVVVDEMLTPRSGGRGRLGGACGGWAQAAIVKRSATVNRMVAIVWQEGKGRAGRRPAPKLIRT